MSAQHGTLVLLRLMPGAGFRWKRNQGAPLVLRSRARDKVVVDALSAFFGGIKLRKAAVCKVFALAFDFMATFLNHEGFMGIKEGEDIVQWLRRRRTTLDVAMALPEENW